MSLPQPDNAGLLPGSPVKFREIDVTNGTAGDPGVALLGNQPVRVRGMCLYGANQLVPKIDALTAETEGVKKAEDIELSLIHI